MSPPAARGELLRRSFAIVLWLSLLLGFGPLVTLLTPAETRARVPYQTFLMASQIAILLLGFGFTMALSRSRRDALGAHLPAPSAALKTLAAAPVAFVVSSFIALQIALPTLLEELRTRGQNASQQNAGAFGQALTKPPLLSVLLWGALLAAISEELFFRGLLWTTLTEITKRWSRPLAEPPADAPPSHSPHSISTPGSAHKPGPSLRDRALGIVLHGGIATLLSAALFGYMHKDLPGGVGIVRFWSTTILGLASGTVRQATGSVFACILLHALYNTIVIGSSRKWFAAPKEAPVLEGIPNTLLLFAVLGVCLIGVVSFAQALRARRARSAFPE